MLINPEGNPELFRRTKVRNQAFKTCLYPKGSHYSGMVYVSHLSYIIV